MMSHQSIYEDRNDCGSQKNDVKEEEETTAASELDKPQELLKETKVRRKNCRKKLKKKASTLSH